MVMIDTEGSQSDILRRNEQMQVSFGRYVQAYERFKLDSDMLESMAKGKLPWVSESGDRRKKVKIALVDYYLWFIEMLDDVLNNGYSFLAIDPIGPIEAGMTAWAEAFPEKSGWTGKTAFGGLEVEAVRPLYENLLEAISRRNIGTILLSSHVSQMWLNKAPVPGKVKPGGRLKVLSRLSTFMGWLLPHVGNEGDAPACAVLKCRWGSESISGDEWSEQRSALPERIPVFNWANVRAYRDGTISFDAASPLKGEVLSIAEREMIEPMMLSDAQMKLMIVGAEGDRQDRDELLNMSNGDLFAVSEVENKLSPREKRLAREKEENKG